MPPIPMWSCLDDGWNSYRFQPFFLREVCSQNPTIALTGEVTVWFTF